MSEDVRKIARTVPELATYDGPFERMGGLTNEVYRAGDAVLRIPGKGTEEYINRKNEAVAALEAAKADVSPAVLHADPDTGIMVTRFIDGARTMSPDTFKTAPGAPARAGEAFRRLHASGAVFPDRFELFAMIDDYLGILSKKDVALPDGYHGVVAEADTVRQALGTSGVQAVACHCDPLCENFLDTGDRMWIVDWEYAGMNDPMWDLGDLSVEGAFGSSEDEAMLQAYFGGEPPAADRARMIIYKAMCDLLWTLWGLIQLANNNPAEDFRAYAEERFARCKALMADPEFAKQLAILRNSA